MSTLNKLPKNTKITNGVTTYLKEENLFWAWWVNEEDLNKESFKQRKVRLTDDTVLNGNYLSFKIV